MKSTTTTFLLIIRLSMVKLSMFLNSRNSPKKFALTMNLPRISMDSICRVASNKIQIIKANTKSRANTISRMKGIALVRGRRTPPKPPCPLGIPGGNISKR